MTNSLNMNNNKPINLPTLINNQEAVVKYYCDTVSLLTESICLLLDGANSMEGNIDMNNKI